jgi:hypothetical protein
MTIVILFRVLAADKPTDSLAKSPTELEKTSQQRNRR